MGLVCANCSADNEGTARFCRKCGARVFSEDMHEASTRDLPPERAASEDDAQPRITGRIDRFETAPPPAGYDPTPHYVPPAPLAPAYAPGGPAPAKRRNWAMILLATFGALVLVCGIGTFFIVSSVKEAAKNAGVSVDGDGLTVKDPNTGSTTRLGNVDPDTLTPEELKWYFPDSTIIVYTTEGDGALTMVMQSEGDLDAVSAFYKKVMGPGVDENDIRDGGDRTLSLSDDTNSVTVVDEAGPGPKQIVVTLGEPASGDPDPDVAIPDVPDVDVPTPPIPPPPPPAKAPRAPGT